VWETGLQITENRHLKIKFECLFDRIKFFDWFRLEFTFHAKKFQEKKLSVLEDPKIRILDLPIFPGSEETFFVWKVPQQNSFSSSERTNLPSLFGFFAIGNMSFSFDTANISAREYAHTMWLSHICMQSDRFIYEYSRRYLFSSHIFCKNRQPTKVGNVKNFDPNFIMANERSIHG
jgi:hypothetical protein